MDDQHANPFQRANKNRPREMSSKRPVPFARDVFQVKKKHYRDPRFDDLSGGYSNEKFEENYSFLEDIKAQEKEKLEKELAETTNPNRRKKIIFLLKRMKNQEVTKKLTEQKKLEESKKKESVISALHEGKKPFFPKKSEEKKQNLVQTFQDLKKSGKLQKYLEKKRKKMTSKDRKRFGKKS